MCSPFFEQWHPVLFGETTFATGLGRMGLSIKVLWSPPTRLSQSALPSSFHLQLSDTETEDAWCSFALTGDMV